MDFSWVKPFIGKAQRTLVRNAPHILMGLGTVGSVTAVIFAAKAVKPATYALADDYQKRVSEAMNGGPENIRFKDDGLGVIDVPDISLWKKIQICGKYYVPAVGMELFSLLCFWGAHGIDVKRQAIIAGLYSTAQEALSVYQQKVTELIGEKAEKEIRNSIAEDQTAALPPPQTNIIMTDDADLWCLIDGQYFRSSYIKIKDAQNDANQEMIKNMYISRADLYWLLDPDHKYLRTTDTDGQVGWCLDNLIVLDTDFGSDPYHRPVLVIKVKDKDGRDYMPSAGFSCML